MASAAPPTTAAPGAVAGQQQQQQQQLSLTATEAVRVCAHLGDALQKLRFLTFLAGSEGAIQKDELSTMMGVQVHQTITQQSRLEKQYGELVSRRAQLRSLTEQAELQRVQGVINHVTEDLRSNNHSLCRHLKDNPSVQRNVEKIQDERATLTRWLAAAHTELAGLSFSGLETDVREERDKQGTLSALRTQERDVSREVASLEAELALEKSEREREERSAAEQMRSLQDELNLSRNVATVELRFAEQRLQAIQIAEQRNLEVEEQAKLAEIAKLERDVEEQKKVTKHIDALNAKVEAKLKAEQTEWAKKKETAVAAQTEHLEQLRERRRQAEREIRKLTKFIELDTKEREREAEAANTNDAERKLLQLEREDRAADLLQREGRLYIKKMIAAGVGGKKKGKKGKK